VDGTAAGESLPVNKSQPRQEFIMPEVSTHPTAQALALFGHGKLSEAQATTVAAHLETCADCRNAVAGLPADSFLGKVRAAKPGGTVLPPPRPGAAANVMGKAPPPAALPADVPPELANHPKFRIVRELGRGGMGVIYLAEHRVMEKLVALKVISPAVLDNPDALARFHAEVKAAGKLDHQNIARAYDADQTGDLHFLVMEFVEGVSLAQLLEQKGPLPLANACHYVRQAALGLQHAFEQGMVHRDIKPQNLMLTPKGLVKVLDFGLARVRDEKKASPRLTRLESFMGTPEYVAQEQALDARQADTRSDIYSLGCTLYALLTGRPPFVEDTVGKMVLAHIEKEPQPLHELRPDVPAELSAVVAKMVAKDPAARYQRPIDVAQALVPFVKAIGKPGGRAVSQPPVASPGTGTIIGGDTSRVTVGKETPKPAAEASAPAEEKGSPFGDLLDDPVDAPAPKKAKKERKEASPTPAAWSKRSGGRKRWPLLAAAGGVLALLLAGIVIGIHWRDEKGPSGTTLSTSKGKEVPNSLGMKFVLVPRGKFWMGERGSQHQVEVPREFYIGTVPITQGQWQEIMVTNPSWFCRNGGGADKVKDIPDADLKQFPVENVSWDDVQKFLEKLNAREKDKGFRYRLPREDEWEYACRGGATSERDCDFDFYFSQRTNDLSSEQANFDGRNPAGNAPKGKYLERTSKVGSYPANELGLFDMHGNVWQWCEDRFQAGGLARVVRGGSWRSGGGCLCRASFRSGYEPSYRDYRLGFRLAAVPSGG